VDVVFDLTKPWPFKENSIGMMRANHVLEHLSDPYTFFREAWKALVPNGNLMVVVPYGACSGQMGDVTHVRAWLPGSFLFLQPGYGDAVFNPQHTNWNFPFSVDIMLRRVDIKMRRLVKWPFKRVGLRIMNHLWDAFNEVSTSLRALKTEDEVEHFKKHRAGNAVSVSNVMLKHEYENRNLGDSERMDFVHLDDYSFGFEEIGKSK